MRACTVDTPHCHFFTCGCSIRLLVFSGSSASVPSVLPKLKLKFPTRNNNKFKFKLTFFINYIYNIIIIEYKIGPLNQT